MALKEVEIEGKIYLCSPECKTTSCCAEKDNPRIFYKIRGMRIGTECKLFVNKSSDGNRERC